MNRRCPDQTLRSSISQERPENKSHSVGCSQQKGARRGRGIVGEGTAEAVNAAFLDMKVVGERRCELDP